MMIQRYENIIQIFFLELLSISPVIIILGNIVPPIPLKVHFVGLGLVFLFAVALLSVNAYKKWLLYTAILYAAIQLFIDQWDIKSIFDFFFGPFVLVVIFDLLFNNKLPLPVLEKYQKRFYVLLWIPLIIAVMQYFEILPITFWNANYINYSYTDGHGTPRPNGFLYHGSELSIILSFIALSQLFNSKTKGFLVLILVTIIAYFTYYKAILGCLVAIFICFIIFRNNLLHHFIKNKRLLSYLFTIFAILALWGGYYFVSTYQKTGYFFHPQFLTGRGSIWNIYIDGIKDYSFINILFGSGIGSGPELFKTYASPDNWYLLKIGKPLKEAYHAHNALLSVFVNSGIVGLSLIFLLFKMIYSQIKQWRPQQLNHRYLLIGIVLSLLLTIGMTIEIFDMAIFWPCLGFLVIKWKSYIVNETK